MIRQAKKEDSQTIWQIRNHSLTRKKSHNQKEIDLRNHNNWFIDKYLQNKDNYCFVLENKNGKVVGYCRLDSDGDKNYTISIAIDPNYHKKGLGAKLLRESLREVKKIKKDAVVLAEIKKDNIPSIKLFEKCNFYPYKKYNKNLYYKYKNE